MVENNLFLLLLKSVALFNHKFYKGPGLTQKFLDEYKERERKNHNRETNAFNISKVAPSIYKDLASRKVKIKAPKPKTGYIQSTLLDSIIMFSKSIQNTDNQDVSEYISSVVGGVFYESLASTLKELLNFEFENRKQIKDLVFQVLFTDNRYFGQESAKPKKLFASVYPTVYELFKLIKRKDKSVLPRLLQSIESWLILDKISTSISKDFPGIPIFTIHDSIVTISGHEAYVKSKMEEIILKYIGYKPELDITLYDPTLLEDN
jgi:hypothetical protein